MKETNFAEGGLLWISYINWKAYWNIICIFIAKIYQTHLNLISKQEQLQGGDRVRRGKSAGTNRILRKSYNRSITKMFYWKWRSRSWSTAFVLVPFDVKYQPQVSPAWAFFASFHRFRDIHISKFVTLKMDVKVVMYNIRSGAIRWKIPDFLWR